MGRILSALKTEKILKSENCPYFCAEFWFRQNITLYFLQKFTILTLYFLQKPLVLGLEK